MSSLEPLPDGTCPLCGSVLMLVENVVVRRETLLRAIEVEEQGEDVVFFPVLSTDTDADEIETLKIYLSCSSLVCRFVFESSGAAMLGEAEPAAD